MNLIGIHPSEYEPMIIILVIKIYKSILFISKYIPLIIEI
jgi:hypothetical protein